MANQTGKNMLVAYRAESVFNTPPGTGSGVRFRPNAGSGMSLSRALIAPGEIRADMKTSMARLGSKSTAGTYSADLSNGTFDPLFEAVMRGTWTAAQTITQATAGLTSIATPTTSTIVATAGSWITAGVRIGDVVRLTNFNTVANNNINLTVTNVTALTLTVEGTPLTIDAANDTTFTLTISKKVFQPATVVRRSFTFEEYYTDIDLSKQLTGVRINSMHVSGSPNGMCTVEFGCIGADLTPLTTGTSPYYVAPTLSSTIALVMVDATIRFGGAVVTSLTSFDFTLTNGMVPLPVIGSVITPDIFDGAASLTGSVSGTRQDFTNLSRFINETELELQVKLVEPESEPKDFLSFYLPRIKLTGADAPFGNDGAVIETLPFFAADREVVTGYDDTMMVIESSAP